MTTKRVWRPVEDGYEYHCQCDDCVDGEDNFWQRKIYVNRDEIGVFFMDGSNESDSIHAPDTLRLCQAVEIDAAPVVPDAVREALAILSLHNYHGRFDAIDVLKCWSTVDAWRESLEGEPTDE